MAELEEELIGDDLDYEYDLDEEEEEALLAGEVSSHGVDVEDIIEFKVDDEFGGEEMEVRLPILKAYIVDYMVVLTDYRLLEDCKLPIQCMKMMTYKTDGKQVDYNRQALFMTKKKCIKIDCNHLGIHYSPQHCV
ncbi:uncharacterized protein [Macrobrachium rosenbergii]|uniref:uncharacterized protein n=1 Tax=Macrobrachium rosenbergii TaxID=79674 RepID=UPI0034D707EB